MVYGSYISLLIFWAPIFVSLFFRAPFSVPHFSWHSFRVKFINTQMFVLKTFVSVWTIKGYKVDYVMVSMTKNVLFQRCLDQVWANLRFLVFRLVIALVQLLVIFVAFGTSREGLKRAKEMTISFRVNILQNSLSPWNYFLLKMTKIVQKSQAKCRRRKLRNQFEFLKYLPSESQFISVQAEIQRMWNKKCLIKSRPTFQRILKRTS